MDGTYCRSHVRCVAVRSCGCSLMSEIFFHNTLQLRDGLDLAKTCIHNQNWLAAGSYSPPLCPGWSMPHYLILVLEADIPILCPSITAQRKKSTSHSLSSRLLLVDNFLLAWLLGILLLHWLFVPHPKSLGGRPRACFGFGSAFEFRAIAGEVSRWKVPREYEYLLHLAALANRKI